MWVKDISRRLLLRNSHGGFRMTQTQDKMTSQSDGTKSVQLTKSATLGGEIFQKHNTTQNQQSIEHNGLNQRTKHKIHSNTECKNHLNTAQTN